jgi:hypothetical protein
VTSPVFAFDGRCRRRASISDDVIMNIKTARTPPDAHFNSPRHHPLPHVGTGMTGTSFERLHFLRVPLCIH